MAEKEHKLDENLIQFIIEIMNKKRSELSIAEEIAISIVTGKEEYYVAIDRVLKWGQRFR